MPNSKKVPRDFSKLPLGRNVDSATGNSAVATNSGTSNSSNNSVTSTRRLVGALVVPVAMVVPNRQQVRQVFNEDTLQELADDIKVRGILEPLVVRESQPGKYEIIAGERRHRAAQLAGLTELPVIVQVMDDEQARLATLVENIQREDLDPADEKRFFEQLQAIYNLSTSEIGKMINKSQSYVSKRLNPGLAYKPDPNIAEGDITRDADSEINNNLFQNNGLCNNSQSDEPVNIDDEGAVPYKVHQAKATSNKTTAFKWRASNFKPAFKALNNTIAALTSSENPPDTKTKERIHQEIAAIETALAKIKSHLANNIH